MAFKIYALLLLGLLFTGCLQTRQALRQQGGGVVETPTTKQAKQESHIDEVNEDFRKLYGRVEVLENQVSQVKDSEELNGIKLKMAQLETKMSLLEETVAKLNSEYKKGAVIQAQPKGDYQIGNEHYEKRKWEDAILAFEEYRKKNPNGSTYSEATYKIGMSFKNLGMKDDAKAFFTEVVNKYPKSSAASRAKKELKKL